MATTPVYGFRYQGLADPPHGPDLGQNLAEDVEGALQGDLVLGAGLTVPTSLSVGGDISVGDDLTVTGDIAVTGDVTVGDDLTVTGDLAVTGIGRTIPLYKGSDESVTSSTSYQNDDNLFTAVVANAVYIVEALLLFTGDAAADAKWQFTMPTGATLSWGTFTVDSSATLASTGSSNQSSPAAGVVTGAAGASTYRATLIRGTLFVSSTAGDFRLQWAQNSSSGTATVLRKGSHMILHRAA